MLSRRCPVTDIQFKLFVTGYHHDLQFNEIIMWTFMAFFAIVLFSKLMKSATDVFAQKKFLKDISSKAYDFKPALCFVLVRF